VRTTYPYRACRKLRSTLFVLFIGITSTILLAWLPAAFRSMNYRLSWMRLSRQPERFYSKPEVMAQRTGSAYFVDTADHPLYRSETWFHCTMANWRIRVPMQGITYRVQHDKTSWPPTLPIALANWLESQPKDLTTASSLFEAPYVHREFFGWPWRCASMSTLMNRGSRTELSSFIVPLPAPIAPQSVMKRGLRLPLGVLWTGFAASSFVLSTSWWLVLFMPGVVRRWLRDRRGACRHCGYDRRGLEGQCPECGRVLGDRVLA
jgi:hypothetical protein